MGKQLRKQSLGKQKRKLNNNNNNSNNDEVKVMSDKKYIRTTYFLVSGFL